MRARWMILLLAMGCGEAGSYTIDPPLPEQPRVGVSEGTGSVEEPSGPREDPEPALTLESICPEVCSALATCGVSDDCVRDCMNLAITRTQECLSVLRDVDLCYARMCAWGPVEGETCLSQETVDLLERCRAYE